MRDNPNAQTLLPLLISCAQLQQALHAGQPIKLIDLSRYNVYAQVHLPHAIHVPSQTLTAPQGDVGGLVPSEAQLATLFGQLGIQPSDTIVAYDDEGGAWAGRFLWTLDYIGHQNHALLDGGLHAWLKTGYELSSEDNTPEPKQPYDVVLHPQVRATQNDVFNALQNQSHDIWDCRSIEEYTGERVMARRGGHIPTAKHFEWTQALNRDNALQAHPVARIKEQLTSQGLTGQKPIITYCQTHHRSGYSYWLGRVLGFNMSAYDGAWSEWGNNLQLPIEK